MATDELDSRINLDIKSKIDEINKKQSKNLNRQQKKIYGFGTDIFYSYVTELKEIVSLKDFENNGWEKGLEILEREDMLKDNLARVVGESAEGFGLKKKGVIGIVEKYFSLYGFAFSLGYFGRDLNRDYAISKNFHLLIDKYTNSALRFLREKLFELRGNHKAKNFLKNSLFKVCIESCKDYNAFNDHYNSNFEKINNRFFEELEE